MIRVCRIWNIIPITLRKKSVPLSFFKSSLLKDYNAASLNYYPKDIPDMEINLSKM